MNRFARETLQLACLLAAVLALAACDSSSLYRPVRILLTTTTSSDALSLQGEIPRIEARLHAYRCPDNEPDCAFYWAEESKLLGLDQHDRATNCPDASCVLTFTAQNPTRSIWLRDGLNYALTVETFIDDDNPDEASSCGISSFQVGPGADNTVEIELKECFVPFVAADGGNRHAVALDDQGRVWAWGKQEGVGLGLTWQHDPVATPTQVQPEGLEDGVRFTMVAAADYHSLALDSNGQLWVWGVGGAGQLGLGDEVWHGTPQPLEMAALDGFVYVAAGNQSSFAIDSEGHTWAWGQNQANKLGITEDNEWSSEIAVLRPAQVVLPDGVTFTMIAGGELEGENGFSAALDEDGYVWTWGHEEYVNQNNPSDKNVPERLGRPDAVTPNFPGEVKFAGNQVTVVSLDVGGTFGVAADVDGAVWTWGSNDYGQLGLGLEADVTVGAPARVRFDAPDVRVVAVAAGRVHALALDDQGRVWGWGSNLSKSSVPASDAGYIYEPELVEFPQGVRVVRVAATEVGSIAIDATGQAWYWGDFTIRGDGLSESMRSPVQVKMPQRQ